MFRTIQLFDSSRLRFLQKVSRYGSVEQNALLKALMVGSQLGCADGALVNEGQHQAECELTVAKAPSEIREM